MNFDTFTPAQRACVGHLDRPLFVAAGAGSGKTFTLQQRIAYALLPDSGPALASIDEVLAITFMEKAAAEIKARVRSALRAEGMFEEALKVDGAWISTIHGMCARILRENALEVGVDPAFSVVMEFEAGRLRDQAIEEVLRAEADGRRFAALFAEYGATPSGGPGIDTSVQGMLKELLAKASSYREGLAAIDLGGEPPAPSSCVREVLAAYEEACALAAVACGGKKPTARQLETQAAAEAAREALNAFVESGSQDAAELGRVFASCGLLRKDGFGKAAGEAGQEAALAVQAALDKALRTLNLARGRAHADALMALAREVEAAYQRKLDERAALDNDGLLRRTLHALSAQPALAQRYRDRFKLVMVDEFQDTNQLQVDLIELVAGTDKLCTVGDAQQSIYRFNGADVSVFERQRARVAALGDDACLRQLDDNFRSHGDVLAFVRRVCGQDQVFGERFLDLSASRGGASSFKGSGARLEVQLVSYEGGKEACGAVAAEAAGIARRFAELRDAGHEASEMVVLLGKMSAADTYADALRAEGFAVVLGGGRSFFALPEVRAVENLLAALADPADTRALYATLTSPLLRLTPDDFVRLSTVIDQVTGEVRRQGIDRGLMALADVEAREERAAALEGEAFSEDAERTAEDVAPSARPPLVAPLPGEPSERLRFAARLFARARARITCERPSQVLMGVIADSGWLGRLERDGVEGTAAAANVLKAVRLVEEIERTPGYGLACTARDFREQAASTACGPGSLSVSGQNAVRIMTIHKSKGLEFPIVASASFEPTKRSCSTFAATSADGRVHAALSAKRTAVCHPKKIANGFTFEGTDPAAAADLAERACAIANREWHEEVAEAQRKFYVACTRASEYLLVCGLVKVGKDPLAGYANTPVFDDVRHALVGEEDFPEGEADLDFGGSAPLHFERVTVCADDVAEATEAEADAPNTYTLPPLAPCAPLPVEPVRLRDDVFSYSSIAPHEDHLPLAERDDLSGAAALGRASQPDPDADFVDTTSAPDTAETPAPPSATDLGTAFHRLAQLAILEAPAHEGRLVAPPRERIEALARSMKLGDAERARLDAALERWFASSIARLAEQASTLRAEVPFLVEVPPAQPNDAPAYLEGEIDLLALSEDGTRAFVVDYKTGGSPDETPERLHEKHLLQATCYAYALLTQGIHQVEFAFVRVERPSPSNPAEPQTVPYTFEAADLPALQHTIQQARARAARS